jgi:hypothetical protein
MKPATTKDIGQIPTYQVPDDASPLDLLLADREADQR